MDKGASCSGVSGPGSHDLLKEDAEAKEEIYLVDPPLLKLDEGLKDEVTAATLFLAINRQGAIFIWVCRDENPAMKRGDIAATSRIEAAEAAMMRYVRVQWRSPAYEYVVPRRQHRRG